MSGIFNGLTTGEKVLFVLVALNLLFLLSDGLYNIAGVLLTAFGIHIGV